MGEARRRKKLDPNYGKLKSLTTLKDCKNLVNQVIDDLYFQCDSELEALFLAENIPDNYREIRTQLAEWMKNRFSKYCDSDHQKMAIVLLELFDEMFKQQKINHITLMCFIEISKSYLPLNISEKMEDMLENFKAELELISPS